MLIVNEFISIVFGLSGLLVIRQMIGRILFVEQKYVSSSGGFCRALMELFGPAPCKLLRPQVRCDESRSCHSPFQESDEVGLQLESLTETTGMGAPALHVHAYEYEAEDFRFDLARDFDVDLLPAPDIRERGDGTTMSFNFPTLGHAVSAVKGWWSEEFTFRGFGIGIVKPIFRGMLLRPDVGVGIRCSDPR